MGTPVRILIADDHELVRRGMRAIIEGERGWEVCGEATTGRQALAMASELKPAIIVLDLSLPEMNGVEVTRHVRAAFPGVAVLIVTMHDDEAIVKEAIEAGASGYILKADAGRMLSDAIRTLLADGEYISERVRVPAETLRPGATRGKSAAEAGTLTAREREVVQLLAEGKSNKEIAATLGISIKTAETHRARIMAKLQIHSITELVRYALRNRILLEP